MTRLWLNEIDDNRDDSHIISSKPWKTDRHTGFLNRMWLSEEWSDPAEDEDDSVLMTLTVASD